MKHVWKLVRTLAARLTSRFPTQIPTNEAAFEKWMISIFELHGLPDLPSYRQTLCGLVMHLDQTTSVKSKYYFVQALRKFQANQIAYGIIDAIRAKDKENKEVAAPVENGVAH